MIRYKKIDAIFIIFMILLTIVVSPIYATAIDKFSQAIDTDGASDLKTEGR